MNNMQDKTEEEYQTEADAIDAMFPDAKFTVSIDIDELDVIVSTEPVIMIKNTYNCYCYNGCTKKTEWYSIRGSSITNKYILNELIRQGLELECNHRYIEFFHKISECQFEIATGS